MPTWDYECPKGHIFEVFKQRASLFTLRVPCEQEGCSEEAEYRPSFWYQDNQNAQRFSPIIIHRDDKGNVRFPGNTNAPVPEGFQKVELTNFHQVRKLENEINLKDRVKAGEFKATREKFLSGQLNENRRVMERLVESFTPRGKKFYHAMKEASMRRQDQGRRDVDPSFFVEALSMDSSNREDHFDASSDWKRIRK